MPAPAGKGRGSIKQQRIMLTKNLPITREVKKLRNTIIGYTADFPKRFKYTIGDRMINVVLDLNKYIRRANEETNPQNRSYYIRELRYLIEDLEDLTDCCMEHKILSIKQVAQIATFVDSVGRQSTGWLHSVGK